MNLIDPHRYLQPLRDIYENKIPFNRIFGFKVVSLKPGSVTVRFEMKEELIGNYVHGILHGGVISSVLDAAGGLAAASSILEKMKDQPTEEIAKSIMKTGTIDLRVDYLRPGRGAYFRATSSIMRAGNRVAVTRMELHNDKDLLIAVGTGTYIVG
ncbi:MAG: thioesterase family protein [Desulfobacterales bacterium]|jgi:uncharacterized protein (TIGR00369 family)